MSGNVTWASQGTASVSVGTGGGTSVDLFTIPSGMCPTNAGILLVASSGADTADSASSFDFSGSITTNFHDGNGTDWSGQPIGAIRGDLLPAYGFNQRIDWESNSHNANITAGAINAGGTVRFTFPPALLGLSGNVRMSWSAVVYAYTANDLTQRDRVSSINSFVNPPNPNSVTYSDAGFIPSGFTTEAYFLVSYGLSYHLTGSNVVFSTSPTPSVGTLSNWTQECVANNGASETGIGFLTTPFADHTNQTASGSSTTDTDGGTFLPGFWEVLILVQPTGATAVGHSFGIVIA